MSNKKKIMWWSAGATSAVAAKLALTMWSNVELIYIHIGTAHKDNDRFKKECADWYGKEIRTVTNKKGYKDQFDVIRDTQYINGAYGARCSKELKKAVREELESDNWENQIFGFEYSKHEINRAIRFKQQHPYTNPLFPLIENKISGEEAHGILVGAGIELPEMYKLGYENNNCIGCVKGGKGYWNKIRKDFPDTFNEMSKIEREINHTCLKETNKNGDTIKIFLDELKPDQGSVRPIVPSCGLFCQSEFEELMDRRVEEVMNGEININDI